MEVLQFRGKLEASCDDHGALDIVEPGGKANVRNLRPGMRILHVNGERFSPNVLSKAEDSGLLYKLIIDREDVEVTTRILKKLADRHGGSIPLHILIVDSRSSWPFAYTSRRGGERTVLELDLGTDKDYNLLCDLGLPDKPSGTFCVQLEWDKKSYVELREYLPAEFRSRMQELVVISAAMGVASLSVKKGTYNSGGGELLLGGSTAAGKQGMTTGLKASDFAFESYEMIRGEPDSDFTPTYPDDTPEKYEHWSAQDPQLRAMIDAHKNGKMEKLCWNCTIGSRFEAAAAIALTCGANKLGIDAQVQKQAVESVIYEFSFWEVPARKTFPQPSLATAAAEASQQMMPAAAAAVEAAAIDEQQIARERVKTMRVSQLKEIILVAQNQQIESGTERTYLEELVLEAVLPGDVRIGDSVMAVGIVYTSNRNGVAFPGDIGTVLAFGMCREQKAALVKFPTAEIPAPLEFFAKIHLDDEGDRWVVQNGCIPCKTEQHEEVIYVADPCTMSVRQAKRKAHSLRNCKGFCFKGPVTTDTDPVPFKIYFNSSNGDFPTKPLPVDVNVQWTSWLRI